MSFGDTNLQKFAQNQQYQPSVAQSNLKPLSSREGFEAILAKFKAYQPRSNIIDLKKLHQSNYLKLKKYKDSAFYGEIVNGKRHGLGVMIYSNDRIYEGQWESDYKNGKGFEEFQNGCIYQGYYVNGKPEGVGKHQWPNGEFYQGEWLSGLKHGSGMWFGAKGDNYVGQWKFGKADGYGVHVWINGDRYEGDFKQCLKHGSGTQRFASGELYKGQFYKGKPSGYGEFFWPNGSYYKGNFKNGLRDGHGIWKLSSGNSDKYEGQYVNGKKHGYGIFTWYAGNIYKGNYFEDQREGYGEMYWTDGSYYKGSWQKGSQQGEGIIFTPDEGIKKGIFRHNQLVQIIIEEQPVINVPLRIRKKKPRTKNLINSNQATPFQQKRKQSPISNMKKYVSLELGSKSPKSNAKLRQKFIKNHLSNRNNSYHSKQSSSRRLIKTPQRVSEFRSYAFNSKQVHENERKNLTTIQQIRKEHMPHSSIYMHKIDKRRSALGSPADPKTDGFRQNQQSSKYREVKPFTSQGSGRFNQSTIL